jgi:hypothetical protein
VSGIDATSAGPVGRPMWVTLGPVLKRALQRTAGGLFQVIVLVWFGFWAVYLVVGLPLFAVVHFTNTEAQAGAMLDAVGTTVHDALIQTLPGHLVAREFGCADLKESARMWAPIERAAYPAAVRQGWAELQAKYAAAGCWGNVANHWTKDELIARAMMIVAAPFAILVLIGLLSELRRLVSVLPRLRVVVLPEMEPLPKSDPEWRDV